MTVNFDFHFRLEQRASHRSDLQRGFMAEIADPVWFLGRQWQMGEHQGENAASPALTRATYTRQPLMPAVGRPADFPGRLPDEAMALSPAETMIEGETHDWWTVGRRIRIGKQAAVMIDALGLPPATVDGWRLRQLPAPYDVFNGGLDGLALFKAFQRGALVIDAALFPPEAGATRADRWQSDALLYSEVDFPCRTDVLAEDDTQPRLIVQDHDGGEVDWWSADATGQCNAPATGNMLHEKVESQPARFNYPGAPNPRWWQIEDARVDIGGFPPDRSHFASMLLLDLVLSHGNDWYTIALEAQLGDVFTLADFSVVDIFGDDYTWSAYPSLKPPNDWSLFQVNGLNNAALVVWPTAAVPVAGKPLEQIALGVDEDANLMWAVEERADGLRLTSVDIDPPADPRVERNPTQDIKTTTAYLYRPSTFVPHHWHPYLLQTLNENRVFVQGRLRDYARFDAGVQGMLAPKPIAELLTTPQPPHVIQPSAVPVTGLRLERRYMLARRSDGTPVLWMQRQRLPLMSSPASSLRFDVLKPVKV